MAKGGRSVKPEHWVRIPRPVPICLYSFKAKSLTRNEEVRGPNPLAGSNNSTAGGRDIMLIQKSPVACAATTQSNTNL